MCTPLKRIKLLLSLCMLTGICNLPIHAQEPTKRILKIAPAKNRVVLKHFHVTKVVDNRKDKSNIGYITTGLMNYFVPAYFATNTAATLQNYLQENIIQYNSTEAVTLQINEYFVHERSSFKGAEIGLKTNYTLFNKSGIKLLDYTRLETRNTGMNMSAFASLLLRQNLVDFITKADKDLEPILATLKNDKKIQVQHIITKISDDKTIKIYDPQKPLNKYNYIAKVPAQTDKDAHSECGLNIAHVINLVNGKPEALIILEPYFDQSKSWIKPNKASEERFAYEQTYLKISAYITFLLTKELEGKTFTLSNIEQELSKIGDTYKKQLAELQTQYKVETNEGQDAVAVDNWKRKIAFYPNLAIR